MIAGEDDHQVRVAALDEAEILLNCVCSAQVPVGAAGAVWGVDAHPAGEVAVQVPGTARADVLDQRVRTVLSQDHDIKQVGVDAVGQGKVDDSIFTTKGNCGLCSFGCQYAQTGAFSAGEDYNPGFHDASSDIW